MLGFALLDLHCLFRDERCINSNGTTFNLAKGTSPGYIPHVKSTYVKLEVRASLIGALVYLNISLHFICL